MKKILSIALIFILSLTLFACADPAGPTKAPGSTPSQGPTDPSGTKPEKEEPFAVTFGKFEEAGNDPNNLGQGDAIAFDLTYVYFNAGALYRMPRTGGNAEKILDREVLALNVYNGSLYGISDSKVICLNLRSLEEQVVYDEEPAQSLFIMKGIAFIATRTETREAIHALDMTADKMYTEIYVNDEVTDSQPFLFTADAESVYALKRTGQLLRLYLSGLKNGVKMNPLASFTDSEAEGIYFGLNGFIAVSGDAYRSYLYRDIRSAQDDIYLGKVFKQWTAEEESFGPGSRFVLGGYLIREGSDGRLCLYKSMKLDEAQYIVDVIAEGMFGMYENRIYYVAPEGSGWKLITVDATGKHLEYSNS